MRHLIAALAALTLALPAAAETQRREDGALTSVITLTDALSARPVFAAFLRDEALSLRADYAARAAEAPGFAWSLTVEDRAALTAPRYPSVLRRIHARTPDGASLVLEPMVWDGAAGDFARLSLWFDPGQPLDEALAAISFRLRKGIEDRLWRRPVPANWRAPVLQATNPDTAVLTNFTLASSDQPGKAAGLTFHYNPGEVVPGRDPVRLTLPAKVFETWLNAEGRRIFGGALRR